MKLRSMVIILGISSTLAGCTLLQHTLNALLPAPWTEDLQQLDQIHQRVMNNSLNSAKVSRLGEQLCRPMQVGLVGQDWIKGQVIGFKMANVAIKIIYAGHEPHELQGKLLTPGQVIWDEASLWTPCQ